MTFPANIDLSSLDGSNGFKLSGAAFSDQAGRSVASAGDVNGDGFADLIVGAYHADPNGDLSGASYVVFGKASGFAANLDLSTLDGSNGFKLSGEAASDQSGYSVASAGDVNGDGFADLIVGARVASPNGAYSGASYVVFGQASGFAANLDLSTLDGTNGFKLNGEAANDASGTSVASAGDVNGDGFADVIIGAPGAGSLAGASYVVFGQASGFAASLDLSSLNGSNGFKLSGVAAADFRGNSVASAGDVNGDGFADLIIGARGADTNGTNSGASYVVFGQASGFAANLDLGSLDGSTGFRLSGGAAYDSSGFSVASAGDVNGDGFADLIVGAPDASPNGTYSGASYVVFGQASGFAANLDLSSLDGSNGFKLSGVATFDFSGWSVASAGDVNGDGCADLIVGAPDAGPLGFDPGASYVVFGKASGFAANLDLSSLDGSNGFKLSGAGANDSSGWSVASAGDVNGDGFADLIVGAPFAAPNGAQSGASYVVFGGAFGATVTTNGTAAAEMLIGGSGGDTLIGGGGQDVFHAGAGDDSLAVSDLAFQLADGGLGTDTLSLDGAGLSLDLTDRLEAVKVQGIEVIDLTGSGDNTLTVDLLGVRVGLGAVTGGKHVLTVLGDAGDTVVFSERQWKKTGSFTNADGSFDRYAFGNAIVDVEQGVAAPGVTIVGTAGDDTIDYLSTPAGQPLPTNRDDTINGLGGNDLLDGRAGADTLVGGTGDDIYFVDNAGDVVTENDGEGIDKVRSAISYDLGLGSNVENLTLIGPAAINGTGNELDNVLLGNASANHLLGLDGNDTLHGGLGADALEGGAGNDVYTVDDAGDVVIENLDAGIDRVRATIGYDLGLGSNVEQLVLLGAAPIDGTGNELANLLIGNAAANHLTGLAGNDILQGRQGADTLAGGLGDDTCYVDDAGDVVTENDGEGTDTVRAAISYDLGAGSNVEKLVLLGGAAIDGTGNELDNAIFGNAGRNVLSGGAGHDRLTGGGGSDVFAFSSPSDGWDIITDFVAGPDAASGDRLQVSAAGFGGGLAAGASPIVANAASAAQMAAAAASGSGYFIFDASDPGGCVLLWDATGGNSADAAEVAVLRGVTTLNSSDFSVV